MNMENPEPKVDSVLKIRDLKPNDIHINIHVKVLEKQVERTIFSKRDKQSHRVAEFLVGDETGTIVMSAWDNTIDRIKINSVYKITNAYIDDNSGYLRLNIGRHSRIEPADVEIEVPQEHRDAHTRTPFRQVNVDYSIFPRPVIKGERKPTRSRRKRR